MWIGIGKPLVLSISLNIHFESATTGRACGLTWISSHGDPIGLHFPNRLCSDLPCGRLDNTPE
jgi:hypothetical protein